MLGYNDRAGGWFQVKGATVTGWISAQPTLSAPGEFRAYSSSEFSALYPATWNESVPPGSSAPTTSAPSDTTVTTGAPAAPSSVVFRPASGSGDIVVTTAGSVSQLPHGRSGYGTYNVSQVVACGVTAGLVVLQQTGTSPPTSSAGSTVPSVPQSLAYLGEIRFTVDAQHALGLYSDMPDLGTALQIFKDLVASLTFPAPQCAA